LDADESVFVDSREGALLLCQGIGHHQRQEYEKARHYYEASRRIHHRLDDADGEGQANLALDVLNNRQAAKEHELLKQLAAMPKVRGDSSILLVGRLARLSQPDQVAIVLAAKRYGLLLPLLSGLTSHDIATQSAAATALAWLNPGPDYDTLVDV